jgi:hypothetical protein
MKRSTGHVARILEMRNAYKPFSRKISLWQQKIKSRLWWGLAESAFGGILESDGRFCVGEFGRKLIYIIKKCLNVVLSMGFAKVTLR